MQNPPGQEKVGDNKSINQLQIERIIGMSQSGC